MINIDTGVIAVQKTDPLGEVRIPAYTGDAGYDLVSVEDVFVHPGQFTKINCGVRVSLPNGISALVIGRSSLIMQKSMVISSLIDSGYRGDIFVFMVNLGDANIHITKGRRIAQLLPIINTTFAVEYVDELPASHRGENGFGSSGK